MTGFLSDEDLARLQPAASRPFASPLPTRIVSSDEFLPPPQSAAQRQVEARLEALAGEQAPRHGVSRRRFLASGAGLAAGFLAMNAVYGDFFAVEEAEAGSPDLAALRSGALAGQFILDDHTHFLRADAGPDSPLRRFVGLREAFARSGKNPQLEVGAQSYDDLLYENYVKEIFFDSDTKIAILSGAPSLEPEYWFLTNEMKAEARSRVNGMAGSRRLMYQAVFMPGTPGWLDELDRVAEELQPDSWKGYTIGDNVVKGADRYPWRMDDEKVVYPGYERMLKAGIRTVCVHKGLFPESAARRWPGLLDYAGVDDVGQAARDWPEMNFVIYHSGFRNVGEGAIEQAVLQYDATGRIDWVSDLAGIPERYGVRNVYGDLGQCFAYCAVSHPKLAAGLLGILVRGLGHERVVWGTDALWQGSPYWQIEALRRLEIPETLQREQGYAPLGPADGPVKQAILGLNSARLYGLDAEALLREQADDAFSRFKPQYEAAGAERSTLVHGFVRSDG